MADRIDCALNELSYMGGCLWILNNNFHLVVVVGNGAM